MQINILTFGVNPGNKNKHQNYCCKINITNIFSYTNGGKDVQFRLLKGMSKIVKDLLL